MVVDVDKLSDAELRTKLLEFGFPVMPITGTTRKVMTKKLKLLLENKNKINNDSGRISLGRYSSEEESDTDSKMTSKRDKNRRATMAAPVMQPPVSANSRTRRSTRIDKSDDVPEMPSSSPIKRETRTSITTTSRSQKILKSAQDEFDTGSDSESDIVVNKYNSPLNANNVEFRRASPIKTSTPSYSNRNYSPPKSVDTSYNSRNVSFNSAASPGRLSSYISPSVSASEYASDRLNQIRSRLSLSSSNVYDKPQFSTVSDKLEKEETPFLSNFTKRLSALSSQKSEYDFKNDIIKEHDANGSSTYSSRNLYRKTTRGRESTSSLSPTFDFKSNQNSILKNNFVSFAVLAGAALFFIFLAIMYLGMKSDTSVVTSGYTVPPCTKSNPSSKPNINCVLDNDVQTAIHLLNVLKPELLKRAVAHKCFDAKIKAHMTEAEIITFCRTNFGIQDSKQISRDLRNLEVLTFANPEWGISVAQSDDNNGVLQQEEAAKNMEQVIFNHEKITSLVIFNPDLPWRCSFYNTLSTVLHGLIFCSVAFILLYLSNKGYKYYKHYEQKQKDEVGFMVEKIIDILQKNVAEGGGDNFVVINHVRDMILPVSNRKQTEKTWLKALQFIHENESRVRTDVEIVKGEPFDVWRWIGSANLSMPGSPRHKSWQGQAFETQIGSVNSLPCSPTPCLKIRGMVEDGDRNTHMIKDAVLSKCGGQCRILHCYVETNSNCVYLKCADTNDAAVAYRNLHGWWYAGQLVTVKYLRLERYLQRFPESAASGPPYLTAISPSTNWAN